MLRSLLIVSLLSGCTAMSPGSALWLNQVDLLSADAADISVALALPPGLGVLPDSVTLSLSAARAGQGSVGGSWTLEETRDAMDRHVYRIAAADRAELRRVQQQAAAWEDADPDGTAGSLSLALGGCRTVPAELLADARASVFLSLAPDQPPRALFRNAPVAEVLSDDNLRALPRCL
ncbi:MAG: hypothetical protein AAGA06_08545 [Pseudomonadota bacterium]